VNDPRERSIDLDRQFYVDKIFKIIYEKFEIEQNFLNKGEVKFSLSDVMNKMRTHGKNLDCDSIQVRHETDAEKIAQNVESNIYRFYYDKMCSLHFRRLFHHIDSTISIFTQIRMCDGKTQEHARRIENELHSNNLRTIGLDKDIYNEYKYSITLVISSLKNMLQELKEFPCNCDSTSLPRTKYFHKLTFVEKTIIIFNIFKSKFSQKREDNVSLSSIFDIPGWCENLSLSAKSKLRRDHFPLVTDTYGLQCKQMIGVYTSCVHHYSREEAWKSKFIDIVLQKECPELHHWHTAVAGVYMTGETQQLLHSLGYLGNFKLDRSFFPFLQDYACQFGVEKRKALSALFYNIVEDRQVARRTYFDTQLKHVPEPPGKLRNQESTREHECGNCKSYNTIFLTEWQSRSADEPTDIFVKCKDCWHTTKVS